MTYEVRITDTAWAELRQGFRWLAEQSPRAADRWRTSLLAAVDTLESHPERCSLAPEDEWYPGELRQLLHGKRGRVYRVLFEIRGNVVHVLRIRHGAQALLKPGDL